MENDSGKARVMENDKTAFLAWFFSQPEVGKVKLTAQQAAWLYETSPGNRTMVRSNNVTIASDMRNGIWCVGNDALMFDKLKRLRNGHHRLSQQIATGTTLEYLYRLNVEESELAVIDRGRKRNLKATVEFVPGFTEEYGGPLEAREATYANTALREGGRKSGIYLSTAGSCKAALLFRDGIKFVIDVVGARRVTKITTTAGVMAVFVRAYTSGEDHEKLRYALNYLIDGGNAIEKGEVARLPGTDSLTRLRDYILTKRFTSAGGSAGKEIYGKTEKMLKAFLEGRDLKKVDEATEELFPVDTSGIIEKPTEAEQQASILGQKLNTVLDQWAGEVTPGYIRPTELVNDLICAGRITGANTTIVGKLSKVARQMGKIVLGKTHLVPCLDDRERIHEYQIVKH